MVKKTESPQYNSNYKKEYSDTGLNHAKHVTINISWQTFAFVLAAIAGIWVLTKIASILMLLFVAGVLATALEPSVSAIVRKGIPRPLAIALIFLFILIITILTIALIVPAVSDQINTLSSNWSGINANLTNLFSDKPYMQDIINETTSKISQIGPSIFSNIASTLVGIVSGIFTILTVMILTIYIISGGRKIANGLVRFIPNPIYRKEVLEIATHISIKLGAWLRGQFILSIFIFSFVFVGLSILKVDYALTLALIAGITEVVPMFGAYLGAVPAVLVATNQSPTLGLITMALFIVIQQFEGNVIVPQVMKKALGLPPLAILLAVMIGGKLLGFTGVLLAAPVAAALSVIIEEIDSRFFDIKRDGNNKIRQ